MTSRAMSQLLAGRRVRRESWGYSLRFDGTQILDHYNRQVQFSFPDVMADDWTVVTTIGSLPPGTRFYYNGKTYCKLATQQSTRLCCAFNVDTYDWVVISSEKEVDHA